MLLDSLRAIAQEGLSYSKNEYDTARYAKLLQLASGQYAALTGVPEGEIRELFLRETGSITPKVGVDVAIMNSKGKLLLLKRNDGTWGMPGGWADVGESPFLTAQREAYEESGLSVVPIGYILVTHKTPLTYPGFVSQVNICVATENVPSDCLITLSSEHTDYKWVNKDEELDNWHPGQRRLIPSIFEAYLNCSYVPDIP